MKKALLVLLLLLSAAPLWAQQTYGEASTEQLRIQANNGDAIAQTVLALRYFQGDRVTKDYRTAVYWWTKAANQGDIEAQLNLGYCYDNGEGVAKDDKQAVYWYSKAANQGNAKAQFKLGACYADGLGVAEDDKQAVYWFTKAANQGYVDAQFNLGACYADGEGVAEDDKQAVYWFTKAANQGDAMAQYNLGVCYANGEGVAKDDKQAVYWYSKAANQGLAMAQYNLGVCYNNGKGVAEDDKQAVYWYSKAANQGHAQAQFNLGFCYYLGNGVSQNYSQAAYWLKKAKQHEDELSEWEQRVLDTALEDIEEEKKNQATTTTTAAKPATTTTTTTSKPATAQSSTTTTNPANTSTSSSANNSSTATYTGKLPSYNKWAHWPWYYNNVMGGLQVSYIQRSIHAREATTGETGHYDFFGNEGSNKGFAIGLHYNPLWDKNLFSLYTGLFLEMSFARQDVSIEYYNSLYDINLYAPVHLGFNMPLGRHYALQVRGGLGIDFSCYSELYDSRDSYSDNRAFSYGQDFINRFNLSADLGVTLHLHYFMLHATYQTGLLRHPFAPGYSCTLDKVSFGVTFLFDYLKI